VDSNIKTMNITEDYVSFEVAKLLKEKGFNEPIWTRYEDDNEVIFGDKYDWNNSPMGQISAPTLQMAMKWLREKYNIYISIQPDFPSDKDYKMCWCWSASILHENCITLKEYQCYIETYEDAVETALKYSLENLISYESIYRFKPK